MLFVVDIDEKNYPDFVVTAYIGTHVLEGEIDIINEADCIRVVVEVGSLGRELRNPSSMDRDRVLHQLHSYLVRMGSKGYRWKKKAVGIAIIGTEFACLEPSTRGKFPMPRAVNWESIYSDSFTHIIDEMANL
jgi:hypothetical protein